MTNCVPVFVYCCLILMRARLTHQRLNFIVVTGLTALPSNLRLAPLVQPYFSPPLRACGRGWSYLLAVTPRCQNVLRVNGLEPLSPSLFILLSRRGYHSTSIDKILVILCWKKLPADN